MQLADLAEQVLDAARMAGADAADTLIARGTSVSIEVRKGALEHAERSEGCEVLRDSDFYGARAENVGQFRFGERGRRQAQREAGCEEFKGFHDLRSFF